jgi:mannose-6-phosphate isomerase-like protein (cupin superfamily)
MIYKVSYVVIGGDYPGGIKNEMEPPAVGAVVQIGRKKFRVEEVHEIIPPRDDFQFLHATVRPLEEHEKAHAHHKETEKSK